ncbi:EF-hand calcium-binding domain-containing protein 11 isoform X2 [Rousettus aegyptiacus]|uniref:EF-hand calcium-binding domain-containing protein 11 isoform X2 n=1 Tax=Rousettus aegyptiacus TaxID=9407 RepID=UPI00168D4C8D|nr:EF-hand calcium-binding domain-containing protein 11 isoform X2 [Rousettus aegyptiacus]
MFFSQASAQPRTWEASPSERKKLAEVFKACDEDNKGYLSREDFKVAVVMLFGYKPSKIEADSVMSSLNPDASGLSLEEFLNFVKKKKELQLYRNEIRHIFTAFDRHYRGYLTLEDFQKAFKQVAPKLPERIILEVFRTPLMPAQLMLNPHLRGFSAPTSRKVKKRSYPSVNSPGFLFSRLGTQGLCLCAWT